jgi:hypothetical protein
MHRIYNKIMNLLENLYVDKTYFIKQTFHKLYNVNK